MRILYITEIYPDVMHGIGVWGGGEKQFYEISRIMAKRGHEVTVLTCKFPGQSSEEILSGVKVVRLGLTRDQKTGGARKVMLPILTYIFGTSIQAMKARPDLVHCNTYFPVFPGKIATMLQKVPLVTTFHDLYGLRGWVEAQRSVMWGLLGHLATVSAAKVRHNRIIAVSPQCKQKLLRLGIRSEKITVIPNGIDLELFDSVQTHRKPCQILYVGRLVSFKHVDKLIWAFAEVLKESPQAKLKIVGGGPQRTPLQNLTYKLNLEQSVTFTGVTPTYEDAAQYFKESTVFVLPSTVEGESIAVKEAMVAGLPVVGMNVPGSGVLSLVEDGVNGFLVDPTDSSALARRLVDLLQDDEKRKAIGAVARRFAEKYDWKTIADQILNVYNDLSR
jgi:glycosyltransferase involved in cell wall biosynthesis